jgi:hypothetical protein
MPYSARRLLVNKIALGEGVSFGVSMNENGREVRNGCDGNDD